MPDRRSLLSATLAAAGAGTGLLPAAPAAGSTTRPTTPQAALDELIDGNRRWVAGQLMPRDPAQQRRIRVAGGQDPFAVVFSCIDSRVPPEIVFDQDLGDLFVVRTAGQTYDSLVGGSVEYGPAHGTPLVMVVGHSRCGAVKATVESIEDGVVLPGNLPRVVDALTPAYHRARRDFPSGATREERIELTVRAQVDLTVWRLREDPVLRPLIEQGTAALAGGIYSLDTGAVTLTAQTMTAQTVTAQTMPAKTVTAQTAAARTMTGQTMHAQNVAARNVAAQTTSTPSGILAQATASRR